MGYPSVLYCDCCCCYCGYYDYYCGLSTVGNVNELFENWFDGNMGAGWGLEVEVRLCSGGGIGSDGPSIPSRLITGCRGSESCV